MNMAIRWLNNGQITYMTDSSGRRERVYLGNQKAPSTPEGRIAAHVELIAAIHLSEMRKEEPREMPVPYKCQTCGSKNEDVCIGAACFLRVLKASECRSSHQ